MADRCTGLIAALDSGSVIARITLRLNVQGAMFPKAT